MVWLSYLQQLGPKITYYIGTLTNDMESATHVLTQTEHQLLPLLGVNPKLSKVGEHYIKPLVAWA